LEYDLNRAAKEFRQLCTVKNISTGDPVLLSVKNFLQVALGKLLAAMLAAECNCDELSPSWESDESSWESADDPTEHLHYMFASRQ
jgi:hypothetical protein